MKAYSLDLRERIVQAVTEHHLHPQVVAERFAVGLTTVKRYVELAATDDLTPKARPGRSRKRHIRAEQEPALRAQLTAHDDATLTEHCRRWQADQGVTVSPASMGRAIRRLGWTRKKRHWQPANAANPPDTTGAPPSPSSTQTASSSSTNRAPTSA